MFRIQSPSKDDLAFFHENGYVAFPAVLTEEGTRGLVDEILSSPPVVEFLRKTDEKRGREEKPHRLSLVPWNDKGFYGMQLLDPPLVTALLKAVIGPAYHFCHSEVRVSMRGSKGLTFHHDNLPLNLEDCHKWLIQVLYYPNGFKRGDASLSVIPGSHRISDWGPLAPYGPLGYDTTAEMLTELYRDQLRSTLRTEELELPPGSMVFMNSRTFHAVSPKPSDSPEPIRLFTNYLYKEPGSPHRYTQVIPPEWLVGAGPERRRLFDREANTGESAGRDHYAALMRENQWAALPEAVRVIVRQRAFLRTPSVRSDDEKRRIEGGRSHD